MISNQNPFVGEKGNRGVFLLRQEVYNFSNVGKNPTLVGKNLRQYYSIIGNYS